MSTGFGSAFSSFPELVSCQRLLELLPTALLPMTAYLRSRFGEMTGISFVDSTNLSVRDDNGISDNRVFAELAGLIRHTHRAKKPTLGVDVRQRQQPATFVLPSTHQAELSVARARSVPWILETPYAADLEGMAEEGIGRRWIFA